jgi:deoxyribodipyrimidine photo-lyase
MKKENFTSAVSSLVWLRRDLRLYDHALFHYATQEQGFIQPIFIFDPHILQRFRRKNDQRLSFLADTLIGLSKELNKRAGSLLIFYGNPIDIIPKLAEVLKADRVFAGEDYEPENIKRDQTVKQALKQRGSEFLTVNDHLLIPPKELVKTDNSPYLVFTPYAKTWKEKIHPSNYTSYDFNDKGRYLAVNKQLLAGRGLNILKHEEGPEALLSQIGYTYEKPYDWHYSKSQASLDLFIKDKINCYELDRNFLAKDGTSKLSPYIRFGTLSIRDCYRRAIKAENGTSWINELIWRDFYAMILYFFPRSAQQNLQEKYHGKLAWPNDKKLLEAFLAAQTGYPIIDAAIRQLLTTGWMHNRARMFVASFLTKHLLTDWQIGEEFFAQHLMDYELSSNVGGWQWAASTGTDAQPYFRVFNPTLQGEKFDPSGEYIKKFIPELKNIPAKYIHQPLKYDAHIYTRPIVDHKEARQKALKFFKI